MIYCYKCKYRGTIPGDAHSCCKHPLVGNNTNPFIMGMDALMGKYDEAAQKLGITANPTGVRKGWFFWPANFDPVWLENCDGYTEKEGTNADKD